MIAADVLREQVKHIVRTATDRHLCGQRDRRGQHEPVVVVRVFTEQVHATGRLRLRFRSHAESLQEQLLDAHESMSTGTSWSSFAFASGKASLANIPAAISVPARYLSLPGAR